MSQWRSTPKLVNAMMTWQPKGVLLPFKLFVAERVKRGRRKSEAKEKEVDDIVNESLEENNTETGKVMTWQQRVLLPFNLFMHACLLKCRLT